MMIWSKNRVILIMVALIVLVAGIFFMKRGEETVIINDGWVEYSGSEDVSFRYPKQLETEYMEAFDWPPQVQLLDETFTCVEAGGETERAGRTEGRVIDGREYCVTTVVEGAVGSIYTQYAYAFEMNAKTAILTFSTRATQCGNYSEPEKTSCEEERRMFDIDKVVEEIVKTMR